MSEQQHDTYVVSSDATTLGSKGDTVTADKLAGLNVAALVKGGHLRPGTGTPGSILGVEGIVQAGDGPE